MIGNEPKTGQILMDPADQKQHIFFVFAKLCIRIAAVYTFKCSIIHIPRYFIKLFNKQSNNWKRSNAKLYHLSHQSISWRSRFEIELTVECTELSKCFASQGVAIAVGVRSRANWKLLDNKWRLSTVTINKM